MKERRKKCVICGKPTTKWQRDAGGPYHCYDGCYSTTGIDRRTVSGKPLWENPKQPLKEEFIQLSEIK